MIHGTGKSVTLTLIYASFLKSLMILDTIIFHQFYANNGFWKTTFLSLKDLQSLECWFSLGIFGTQTLCILNTDIYDFDFASCMKIHNASAAKTGFPQCTFMPRIGSSHPHQ